VSSLKKAGAVAAGVSVALFIAACSSNSSTSSSSSSSSAPAASAPGSGSGSASGSITIKDLDNTFAAMSKLTSIAAAGKGAVAVILPDTVTSTRYVEFDKPLLTEAFAKAGLPASELIMQNALGSDATQVADAQADITKGASVLVVDPLDSGTGAHIESYAKSQGVQVIDYDRLTLGGSRSYYVSFDNVKVGEVMAQGLEACVTAWGVRDPNVIFMKGAPTDNNATLFAQGSSNVLQSKFSGGSWKEVSQPAGTWTPDVALSEFTQQYTAHSNINAALIPNDENAAPIIHYLTAQGVKPKTFPITGQDATLTGLQNILAGYQCGTVYKPIYLEAEAAAALALYVRAGQTPPSGNNGLVNGQTKDSQANVQVPSVLLNPEWVTPANMNSTIISDKFVPAAQLCAGAVKAACTAVGISG
jgi:D-xylose transport system substrate-binding protein